MSDIRTEFNDLNLHATLCAERYKGIQDTFERLENRMEKVETKVDSIHTDFTEGQKSMKTTIITTFGSVLVALIGLLGVILMK